MSDHYRLLVATERYAVFSSAWEECLIVDRTKADRVSYYSQGQQGMSDIAAIERSISLDTLCWEFCVSGLGDDILPASVVRWLDKNPGSPTLKPVRAI